jgi:hypothetical protein
VEGLKNTNFLPQRVGISLVTGGLGAAKDTLVDSVSDEGNQVKDNVVSSLTKNPVTGAVQDVVGLASAYQNGGLGEVANYLARKAAVAAVIVPLVLLTDKVPEVSPAPEDVGLSTRGLTPEAGTRIRPEGIPENWRITGTDSSGGTRYYDPSNPGNSVRVMQGNPNSPYPNSQAPYVRWPLDVFGNKLPSAKDPAAHIPLGDFRFLWELFQ